MAQTKSLFPAIIEKYFDGIIGRLTDLYNDSTKEPEFLFVQMLTEEYSADLTWSSAEFHNNIVAADVVSMDSSLPLKKRDTIRTAVGTLPKLGIAYSRGEKFLSDVRVMAARGAREAEIATKILADVARCARGIQVRKEIMFLQGLSTGATIVNDPDDPSVGIRVTYGYRAENFFSTIGGAWGSAQATPISDIQQLFDKALADGASIGHVMLSKKYFNLLRNSVEAKKLAAANAGQVIVNDASLMVPSRATMLSVLEDEFGATFEVVDATYRIEKADGTAYNVTPWEQANVVAMPSRQNAGRLVYGSLAEESNPVNEVTYAKVGSHILIAEFGDTNPLREWTTGQALCLPVIDNVYNMYVLEANKVGVVADPESLSFPKSGSTKQINVTAETAISAASNQSWLTVSVSGKVVSATAAANSGEARSAIVTITDGNGKSTTVAVSQAANA